MQKISDLWKKLSDKEKEKYLKLANTDKSKLEIEKKSDDKVLGKRAKPEAKGATGKKPAAKTNAAKKGKKSEEEKDDEEDDDEEENDEEDDGEEEEEEEGDEEE